MINLLDVAILIIILVIFSVVSLKKRALDWPGVVIANIVGIAIFYLGGVNYFYVTVLFFVLAEASTRISSRRTKVFHKRRTTGNIFGNSGIIFCSGNKNGAVLGFRLHAIYMWFLYANRNCPYCPSRHRHGHPGNHRRNHTVN